MSAVSNLDHSSMAALIGQVLTGAGMLFLGLMLALATLLLMQTVAACMRTRFRTVARSTDARPRVAVLIPAHNEVAGVAATLATIGPQLMPGDRLIVIADNCTDETVRAASIEGVEVIERQDTVLRGKGYALDYGLRYLEGDPPEVVMMFDADCVVGAGCVATLAIEALASRRPIQALYLIRAAHHGVLARLSEFAYRLRNWVRPIGMLRFDLPCQLMGSGMAFHWSLLPDVSFASGHLTEDLQLGLAFARLGKFPRFCPAATVDSLFVIDAASATVQRTRWEHGHLGTIVTEWPGLAWMSLRRLDVRLALMAWDLAIPPLALFSTILLIAVSLSTLLALFDVARWPLALVLLALVMLLFTIVLAQRRFARDLIRLREIFLAVPLYLIRKAPVYLRFMFQRQVEWIRTKRDAG